VTLVEALLVKEVGLEWWARECLPNLGNIGWVVLH
jgi:hypothetical protein